MEYIVYKRFKGQAIDRNVNIAFGTLCTTIKDLLVCGEIPICLTTSENAHQHFARNDDGNGIERGKLITTIQNKLKLKSAPTANKAIENRNKIWERIWNDGLCQKYKRKEFDDYWLWNHDFFNAPIEDLRYISNLLK